MALVRLNTDQSGLSGRSDMILPARSSILKEIQDVLGDEKISSEMRAFCELCEEVNLEPLAAMSKDELVTLSGNCKKAIAQCRYYNVHPNILLTFTLGQQRAKFMEPGITISLPTTPRSSTLSNKVCLSYAVHNILKSN